MTRNRPATRHERDRHDRQQRHTAALIQRAQVTADPRGTPRGSGHIGLAAQPRRQRVLVAEQCTGTPLKV
jgi:hypothetical protein